MPSTHSSILVCASIGPLSLTKTLYPVSDLQSSGSDDHGPDFTHRLVAPRAPVKEHAAIVFAAGLRAHAE